jgi:hypothetical protein
MPFRIKIGGSDLFLFAERTWKYRHFGTQNVEFFELEILNCLRDCVPRNSETGCLRDRFHCYSSRRIFIFMTILIYTTLAVFRWTTLGFSQKSLDVRHFEYVSAIFENLAKFTEFDAQIFQPMYEIKLAFKTLRSKYETMFGSSTPKIWTGATIL